MHDKHIYMIHMINIYHMYMIDYMCMIGMEI